MTDDLWFTSMQELSTKWLSTASPAERAMAEAETAHIYLGGPADARRMRDIPPEKFEANSLGGDRQHEPRRKRRVRDIDLPIGRLTPERAETYGLDYEKWHSSYHKALAVDLKEIQREGRALARALRGRKNTLIESALLRITNSAICRKNKHGKNTGLNYSHSENYTANSDWR